MTITLKKKLIYFAQAGINGPIKIGFSADLYERLQTLQVCNASVVFLIGLIEGTQTEERIIHEQFSQYRIRGEWFINSLELLEFIRLLPVELLGLVNFEWGDCIICGAEATDRRKDTDGLGRQYCRRCLMKTDGRFDALVAMGHRPRIRNHAKPCKHCGVSKRILRKGLCGACSEYFRRRGVDRPLAGSHGTCINCGTATIWVTTLRCKRCRSYKHMYGIERPKRVWEHASASSTSNDSFSDQPT